MTPRVAHKLSWCVALALWSGPAMDVRAHDTGFGHSSRTIFVRPDADGDVVIEYRLRLNDDEALIQFTHMDSDGDGTVAAVERAAFLQRRGAELIAGLPARRSDGSEGPPLRLDNVRLGHSLVQVYTFRTALPAGGLEITDLNFRDRPGRVEVRHAAGLQVEMSQTRLFHAGAVTLQIRAAP